MRTAATYMKKAKRARRTAYSVGITHGYFTEREWLELCARYDHKCLKCRQEKPLTPDHVLPLSKGGDNWITNIQPLCLSCNSSKGAKFIDYRPTMLATSKVPLV